MFSIFSGKQYLQLFMLIKSEQRKQKSIKKKRYGYKHLMFSTKNYIIKTSTQEKLLGEPSFNPCTTQIRNLQFKWPAKMVRPID